MRKKILIVTILMILFSLVLAATAQATVTKYSFNDVVIEDETGDITVEIEASVKTTNKSDFSTCSYFSDDYIDYLGYYEAPVSAGETGEDVLDFCVRNFDERSQ